MLERAALADPCTPLHNHVLDGGSGRSECGKMWRDQLPNPIVIQLARARWNNEQPENYADSV